MSHIVGQMGFSSCDNEDEMKEQPENSCYNGFVEQVKYIWNFLGKCLVILSFQNDLELDHKIGLNLKNFLQSQSFFDSCSPDKSSEFGSGNDLSNDGLSAWLGPHVWTAQIGLEVSTGNCNGSQPEQVQIKREKLFNDEW